jgi:hypothetical protein
MLPDEGGRTLGVRRVVIRLDTPTRDGDTELAIVTNLPADKADALAIAELYRKRWTLGASSKGRITQSVKVRPRPRDSRPRSVGGTVARNQDGEALRQSLERRLAKLQVAA